MLEKLASILKSNGGQLYSISMMSGDTEQTLNVTPSTACHNSYSVAKLFTATAIGMLADSGKLRVEDKIYDILKVHFPSVFDEKWTYVTVKDVLLHKIGITSGFLDIDVEDIFSYGTDDFLGYCFSRKIEGEVGKTYAYSDAAYYILSRVVSEISGENLCDFLMPRLFMPLRFQEVAWSVCPHGYSMGATGLYIRTCDMVKLGRVYLDDGMYNGQQIVSKEWVEEVFKNQYELSLCSEKSQSYYKGGMYGQMLCVSKAKNTAVAWHAFDPQQDGGKALEVFSNLN